MASYSIVLNLSGNAVSNAQKLAKALGEANTYAGRLTTNLATLQGVMRGMPAMPQFQGSTASGRPSTPKLGTLFDAYGTQIRPIQQSKSSASSPAGGGTNPSSKPSKRWQDDNMMLSYGVGPNGFSWRATSILRPDEHGKIFGMDAANLMRNINIAAIAGNVMKNIGESLFNITKTATIMPLKLTGQALQMGAKVVQSQQFADGVRLNMRRDRAKMIHGGEVGEMMQREADTLAASWGFERSAMLGSMMAMTGMSIMGGTRKLTFSEAAHLTKAGGFIGQASGIGPERTLINIQQILAAQTPYFRDIREILHQEPLLNSLAVREMEAAGISGITPADYLKDVKNLLPVLSRYVDMFVTNQAMQARGNVQRAIQDAWAEITQRHDVWQYVGRSVPALIGTGTQVVGDLASILVGNSSFRSRVEQIHVLLEKVGELGVNIFDKWITKLDNVAIRLGVDAFDARHEGWQRAMKRETIEQAATSESFINFVKANHAPLADWENEDIHKLFATYTNRVLYNSELMDKVETDGAVSKMKNWLHDFAKNVLGNAHFIQSPSVGALYAPKDFGTTRIRNEAAIDNMRTAHPNDSTFTRFGDVSNTRYPKDPYGLVEVPYKDLMEAYLKHHEAVQTATNPYAGQNLTQGGDDLSGFNRDRRHLEINFNAPLVQMGDTTITSTDPVGVATEIGENIESMISHGIQVALLGATQKMNTRWT